jgi:hypothetical protein
VGRHFAQDEARGLRCFPEGFDNWSGAMNSVSKFTIALAIATAKVAALDAGLAAAQTQTITEQQLYQLCLTGSSAACSTFLELFPNSPLATTVASLQVTEVTNIRQTTLLNGTEPSGDDGTGRIY